MMKKLLIRLASNRNKLLKAICGLTVAFLVAWGITLSIKNKNLSESLEMAQNNIEAYQSSNKELQQANNVLRLNVEDLQDYNDKLVNQIDSVRKELSLKPKSISVAATQTLLLDVKESKGVGGDIISILRDTTYSDTIKYNDYTTVSYCIGKDTVSIGLNVQNTQYLYLYYEKKYKHKKNFFKRLFTLDFKKVKSYKYSIVNTNDLLNEQDVKIIEINK